jgi:DNA-binding CsgD family transcriptional regulator
VAVEWRTVQRGPALGVLESTLKSKNRLGAILVGSAGVGKTVLARHAVDRFAQRHGKVTVHWLAGTASARQIPFGAFSHLVDVAGVGDSSTLLRSARAALLRRCGDGLLLAVDDAHQLDNLSATLVHQLALAGSARFVVTARSGEPSPDAITSLWKDRLLDRLDIEPFDLAQTTSLVESVLGGPLETASADAVFVASQGNPLYLRHLVENAVESGVLRAVDGVWQLRGRMALSPVLSALIGKHLDGLPVRVRSVLEYLAVEEPLNLRDLTELAGRDALEEAEDHRTVEVIQRGDDLVVHFAHPLYGEHVRESLGRLATRRLRTELVAQLSSQPVGHVSAKLRLTALAVESDTPPPVGDVVGSAWEAMRLGDLLLGERLARSALHRTEGLPARLALAHALSWLGRGRDADDVLSPVDPGSLSEWELTSWTLPKAANEFWMLDRPESAVDFLYAMRDRVTEPAAVAVIDALAATFAMNAGDPRRAISIAADVLGSPASQDLAIAWAAATATLSGARLGRFGEAKEFAARGLAAAHPGLLRFTIGLGEITTLLMTGSAPQAQRMARHFMEFSGMQQPGRAIGEILLARTLMVSADLTVATTLLRQSAAALVDTGYSWGPLALMYLAQALGQQGDAAGSAEVLARAESRHSMRSDIYAPELALGRAWTFAAARNMPGAIAAAREAARIAERSGQLAIAVHALHESVRLGDATAADAIARVGGGLDCVAARVALTHGRALAAADPTRLLAVAAELAELGMTCAAADAAAQAARIFAARGERKGEVEATARAARLAGGAATPALEQVLNPLPLTRREREVAVMVSEGMNNKAIAERIGVSVRTVEGHVYRACMKLNVADRALLGEAIAAAKSSSGLRTTTPRSPSTL